MPFLLLLLFPLIIILKFFSSKKKKNTSAIEREKIMDRQRELLHGKENAKRMKEKRSRP